jgi:hypothetical protein
MAGSSAAERPERPYHPSGSANGNGRPKMPGTPQRRETMSSLSHAREKAVQDPGLKDYVCFLPLGLGSRLGAWMRQQEQLRGIMVALSCHFELSGAHCPRGLFFDMWLVVVWKMAALLELPTSNLGVETVGMDKIANVLWFLAPGRLHRQGSFWLCL